jgi:hypothetical protein
MLLMRSEPDLDSFYHPSFRFLPHFSAPEFERSFLSQCIFTSLHTHADALDGAAVLVRLVYCNNICSFYFLAHVTYYFWDILSHV